MEKNKSILKEINEKLNIELVKDRNIERYINIQNSKTIDVVYANFFIKMQKSSYFNNIDGNVTAIYLKQCNLTNVKINLHKSNITFLYIDNCTGVESFLKYNFKNIVQLIICDVKLNNLDFLQFHKKLKIFGIYQITGLKGVDTKRYKFPSLIPLRYLENLKLLILCETILEDLSFVDFIPKIEGLICEDCEISDITNVTKLKELQLLRLGYNNIKEITPLFSLPNLHYVNLRDNNIYKLSKYLNFKKFYNWIVNKNQVYDSHDDNGILLNTIILHENPLMEPPAEIIRMGEDAILDYLNSLSSNLYLEDEKIMLLKKILEKTDSVESLVKKADSTFFIKPNISGIGFDLIKIINAVQNKLKVFKKL